MNGYFTAKGVAVEGNGAGGCVTGENLLLSGGWAVGYDVNETVYIVYLVAQVVVVAMCVGSEGEGGHYKGGNVVWKNNLRGVFG